MKKILITIILSLLILPNFCLAAKLIYFNENFNDSGIVIPLTRTLTDWTGSENTWYAAAHQMTVFFNQSHSSGMEPFGGNGFLVGAASISGGDGNYTYISTTTEGIFSFYVARQQVDNGSYFLRLKQSGSTVIQYNFNTTGGSQNINGVGLSSSLPNLTWQKIDIYFHDDKFSYALDNGDFSEEYTLSIPITTGINEIYLGSVYGFSHDGIGFFDSFLMEEYIMPALYKPIVDATITETVYFIVDYYQNFFIFVLAVIVILFIGRKFIKFVKLFR